MLVTFSVLTLLIEWNTVIAEVPPEEGSCTPKFMTVHPPKIMFAGTVMQHTDDFTPSRPDCLSFKFARRASFNSNFRMDIIAFMRDNETEETVPTPIAMNEVSVVPNEPFQLTMGAAAAIPPHFMITDLEEEVGCYAAWACIELNGLVKKSAWVVCKETDVDTEVVENLFNKVCEASGIQSSSFFSSKLEICP